MPQTPLDQAKLLQGLEQDLAQAESTVSSSDAGRGNVAEPMNAETSFRPKAIRFKGKVMAESELKSAHREMDRAIEYLTENQQFKDQNERRSFQQELSKRMNKFQMDLMKSGAQMEFELKKRGLDQESQQAMFKSFGDAAAGAAMAAVAFGGKKKQPGTDYDQMSTDAISQSKNYIDGPMQNPMMGQASGYGNTPRALPSPTPGPNLNPGAAQGFQDSLRNANGTQGVTNWGNIKKLFGG